MRWSPVVAVLMLICSVLLIVAALSPSREQVEVNEVETERLVCAVATRPGADGVAISCVPNIPGMFEEPGR